MFSGTITSQPLTEMIPPELKESSYTVALHRSDSRASKTWNECSHRDLLVQATVQKDWRVSCGAELC